MLSAHIQYNNHHKEFSGVMELNQSTVNKNQRSCIEYNPCVIKKCKIAYMMRQ